MKHLSFFTLVLLLLMSRTAKSQVSQEWVSFYDQCSFIERAEDVAVDDAGNVYVAGYSSCGFSLDHDVITIKYNPDGDTLWVRKYDGPATSDDYAFDVEVDVSGNVYTYGYRIKDFIYSLQLVKYDAGGVFQWVQTKDTASMSGGKDLLKVDDSGNAYVTGRDAGGHFYCAKYNTGGTLLWENTSGPIANAVAMDLDAAGNVYVFGDNLFFFHLTSYNSAGGINYSHSFNFIPGSACFGIDVSTDGSFAYVTGYQDNAGGTYDVFVAKYGVADTAWTTYYHNPAAGIIHDYATDIEVTDSGNVFVSATSVIGSGNYRNLLLMQLDAVGDTLWTRSYAGAVTGENHFPSAIAVNDGGDCFMTGYTVESGIDPDYITIAYNSAGTQLWLEEYDGPDGGELATSITLDEDGCVYITGNGSNAGTVDDMATIKYCESSSVPDPRKKNCLHVFPVPAGDLLTIQFTLEKSASVGIHFTNMSGEKIQVLSGKYFEAGTHLLNLLTTEWLNGIYLAELSAGDFYTSAKVVLVKTD